MTTSLLKWVVGLVAGGIGVSAVVSAYVVESGLSHSAEMQEAQIDQQNAQFGAHIERLEQLHEQDRRHYREMLAADRSHYDQVLKDQREHLFRVERKVDQVLAGERK